MKGKGLFVLGILLIGLGVVFQVTPAEEQMKKIIEDTKETISNGGSGQKGEKKDSGKGSESYQNAYHYQPEEAIDYETATFNTIDEKSFDTVYYSNHNDNSELTQESYSMKDYQTYVNWVDWKMYSDSNFRQEYSEKATKKGDYTYMNTGELLKTSYDYPKLDKNKYDYEITNTSENETNLSISVTLTKAENYNLYDIKKEDIFFSLMNEIIKKYVDLPTTTTGGSSQVKNDNYGKNTYTIYLSNQINIFAGVSGEYTEDSGSFSITLYRAKEIEK